MEPARHISPLPDWMSDSATRDVMLALAAGGAEVRFVGGCVRDALVGRTGADVDIDIATPEPPETVIERLHAAGIRSIPTGIAHGTVTAVTGAQHFEITTLRVDVETYGRHAQVAFTDDWAEDAARRDFTMNALSCSAEGAVYDPWGGIADLEAGHVRFVGDAGTRIEEDHLRLLRYFRFHAWYGRGLPDEAALSACASWAPSIAKLSGERLRNETLKLLAAPDPVPAVDLMTECGVLPHLLPGAGGRDRLQALIGIGDGSGEGARGGVEGCGDPLLRLAALLQGGDAGALAERFRLSNADRDRLVNLVGSPETLTVKVDAHAMRVALYRQGARRYADKVLLAWASAGGGQAPDAPAYKAMLAAAEAWVPVALPVRGEDVLALGVAAGPRVGELLAEVETWWLAADFAPDRPAALDRLKELVAAGEPR